MRIIITFALLLATTALGAAQMSPAPLRVRGVVASTSANSLVVTTQSGPRKVEFSPKTKFLGVTKGSLDQIAPGSFIGTTVEHAADGSLESVEVHIFPPEMKGAGEGYRPMAAPNHMMANATVQKVEQPHMMANATVKSTGSSQGSKTVVLVYKGGSQTVKIGPNVPIVAYKPGTKSLLAVGAHVSVMGSQEGDQVLATRVQIGENGVIPR